MAKKKFNVSPLLIEASNIVDTFKNKPKPQPTPKRKNTIEAFTKKPVQGDSNGIPTVSQGDSNIIPRGFQRYPKGIPRGSNIPRVFQGYPNGIPTVSQHLFDKIILSKNQSIVYKFLVQNQNQGIFNKPFIEKNTGVSYGTISDIIRKFKKLEILIINYDKFAKVYFYKINSNIKIEMPDFFSELDYGNLQYHPFDIPRGFQGDSKGIPTPFQGDSKGIPTPSLSSSSLYINKTTTTKINIELNNNPELGYWRQKKITSKQIITWMKTADCNLNTIIQYLCYCRFEMVDLDFEKSKPIENVFNWLFKILEKTGGYPKPKGYKSFQEKKIKTEYQIAEQKEKEAKELHELYRRKVKAEQDKIFWSMMNEPEGKLYKKCFEELNDFQKKRNAGKAFEMSMRGIFKKMLISEDV